MANWAIASDVLRRAYKHRPRSVKAPQLARTMGLPSSWQLIYRMIYSRWTATPLQVGRIEKLAASLGVPPKKAWRTLTEEDLASYAHAAELAALPIVCEQPCRCPSCRIAAK